MPPAAARWPDACRCRYSIPLGGVLAGVTCHDSPLLASTLGLRAEYPLLDSTAHPDAGYDSDKTRRHPGKPAVVYVEPTQPPGRTPSTTSPVAANAEPSNGHRSSFDLADTIITVRSLIRPAWTTHPRDNRPNRYP
jgi:hypothetical protein